VFDRTLLTHCFQVLADAALDVIVFADQLSEPQSYTYNFGRFAAVHVVFWGNPVTAGHIDSSDYFMSADVMEIPTGQLHYTEQLLRPDGQGIWCVLLPL
jgi:predicted O-linked N-acetylglucosamine transferase (SPINDLY family)